MIKIIKEFIAYKKAINIFDSIDLSDNDKIKLESIDKETLDKIISLTYNNLAKEVIKEKLPRDYVLWYRHALNHIRSYFRKYIIK